MGYVSAILQLLIICPPL